MSKAALSRLVLPIAIAILIFLFVIQSRGTAKVGALFGPIMIVYFTTLAVLGTINMIVQPGDPRGAQPLVGVPLLPGRRRAGLPGAGLGGAGGDGGRGALCRHGAFRPQADHHFVAVDRAAGADAQLSGAGRAADGQSGCGRQPVLPAGARGAAAAAGDPGDAGRRHRQPGGDLGGVFGDAARRCSWASCRA